MKMSPEILEGLKSLLRTALMAVVPLVIAQLQSGTIDWKAVAIAGAIALLVGIDKWLHESDNGLFVEEKGKTVTKAGLLPF